MLDAGEDTLAAVAPHIPRFRFILKMLRLRFGALPDAVLARVATAGMAELDACSTSLLTAPTLDDVFAAR